MLVRSTACEKAPDGHHAAFRKQQVPAALLIRYMNLKTKRCAYCKAVVHLDRHIPRRGLHTIMFVVEETP